MSSISVTLRKQGAGLGSEGGPSVGEIVIRNRPYMQEKGTKLGLGNY